MLQVLDVPAVPSAQSISSQLFHHFVSKMTKQIVGRGVNIIKRILQIPFNNTKNAKFNALSLQHTVLPWGLG